MSNKHKTKKEADINDWQKKPLLQIIYNDFFNLILKNLNRKIPGGILELGSGGGRIKSVIPDCITSEMFADNSIDRQENAYKLNFDDNSLSNLILFDVFHHLHYPGSALKEFNRVLAPNGRVIIFEPAISLLGRLVYGLLHPEPLSLNDRIEWQATDMNNINEEYYAAQGNAHRIFCRKEFADKLENWQIIKCERISSISYVLSGGYSGPQLYPTGLLPLFRKADKVCQKFPSIFATRLLIVLEKNRESKN